VDPVELDVPFTGTRVDRDVTPFAYRRPVLGKLVTLREIGIEVILSIEDIEATDLAVRSDTHFYRELDHFLVQAWQRTRMTERNDADIRVGHTAIGRRV
jgi:hypothetical protein